MESIPYDDEANLLSSDSKFRSYASNMDKALKAFEGSGEWADLINSLTKIQKVSHDISMAWRLSFMTAFTLFSVFFRIGNFNTDSASLSFKNCNGYISLKTAAGLAK